MDGFAFEPHADLAHHVGRRVVADRVHAHDTFEAHTIESEREHAAGGFGGVAVSPAGPSETPSDLDRRHDLGQEVRDRESGEADQLTGARQFQREETESALVPSLFERAQPLGGLGAGTGSRRRR